MSHLQTEFLPNNHYLRNTYYLQAVGSNGMEPRVSFRNRELWNHFAMPEEIFLKLI